MLNKLYELNPFFEISVNNITVLCNLDNAFAFRCSDIMNEFKTLYPEHCIDEIENILVTINEQIQNIAQKKDTLCRRMYN